MSRSYPYGKVPSSVATVISERFEKPMVDCGYCSGQMLARSARGGIGVEGRVEGHHIRARGGRAHWAGNNASELRRGLDLALDVKTIGITKAGVLNRVRAGFGVAVSLTYRELPGYLKVQANDFGHCSFLKGQRVTDNNIQLVGYFDPLFEQGSQGTWARWYDVEQALWSTGHTAAAEKYIPPTARYTIHIAKGATVREYHLGKSSTVGVSCIAKERDGGYGVDTIWSRSNSKASCMVPIHRKTCDGKSGAVTAMVTGGAFKDSHIKVDPKFGVTVTRDEE